MPKAAALPIAYAYWLPIMGPKIAGTVSVQRKEDNPQAVKEYPIKLPATPLCDYCEHAFRGFAANDESSIRVMHHPDLLAIVELAREGCIICAKIVELLNYKYPPRPQSGTFSVGLGFFRTREGAILLSWDWDKIGYSLGEMSPTTGPRKSSCQK
jgi:hypothetical protein